MQFKLKHSTKDNINNTDKKLSLYTNIITLDKRFNLSFFMKKLIYKCIVE